MSNACKSALARYGYTIDPDALEAAHEVMGEPLNENVRDWHEITAVFLAMAYKAGQNGKTLTEAFPWIVEI